MSTTTATDQTVLYRASCCNARMDGRLLIIEQTHCDHDDGIGNCPNWEEMLRAIHPWAHWRWIGPSEEDYQTVVTYHLIAP